MIECILCSAGNITREFKDFNELRNHFETHEHTILAMALSDLYEIIYKKREMEKKNKK